MQRTHHIKCGKENKVSNAKKKELFVWVKIWLNDTATDKPHTFICLGYIRFEMWKSEIKWPSFIYLPQQRQTNKKKKNISSKLHNNKHHTNYLRF
jgi:hypothetical protein